jgi:hypothetical protein
MPINIEGCTFENVGKVIDGVDTEVTITCSCGVESKFKDNDKVNNFKCQSCGNGLVNNGESKNG